MNENELLEKINASFDTMNSKLEATLKQNSESMVSLTEEVNNLKAEMLALKEQAAETQKANENKDDNGEQEAADKKAKLQASIAQDRANNVDLNMINTDNDDQLQAQIAATAAGFQTEPVL